MRRAVKDGEGILSADLCHDPQTRRVTESIQQLLLGGYALKMRWLLIVQVI
jgi:hypothetical protein